jgi:hypothetical protein
MESGEREKNRNLFRETGIIGSGAERGQDCIFGLKFEGFGCKL